MSLKNYQLEIQMIEVEIPKTNAKLYTEAIKTKIIFHWLPKISKAAFYNL